MTQLKNNRMAKYIFAFIFSFGVLIGFSVQAQNISIPTIEQRDGVTTIGSGIIGNDGGFVNTTATPNVPVSTAPKLSISGIVTWIIGLIDYLIKFILVLSLVAFLWGIFRLVFLNATNEAERAKAKKFMLWGIIALFVMTSVWGLVNVLRSSLFGTGNLIIPQLK